MNKAEHNTVPLKNLAGYISRQISDEGIVLIKNDGVLPLQPDRPVCVFGAAQTRYFAGGGGSGLLSSTDISKLGDVLSESEKEGKLRLFTPLLEFYSKLDDLSNEPDIPEKLFEYAAGFSSVAIVFISRFTEENKDNAPVKGEYYLSDSEAALVGKLRERFESVIAVFNIGAVIDTSWLVRYRINAALIAWYPGIRGAYSVVDVLNGTVNPSGKLADTFAADYTDYPSAEGFCEKAVCYGEDIYVGYRYFETVPGACEKVNYGFGFGLSYTTFSINAGDIGRDGDAVSVSLLVTNTGSTAGKETVQIYCGAPAQSLLGYPAKRLTGYKKTGLLKPGESCTVTVSFNVSSLGGFDDTGKIKKSSYVLEAGTYMIYVGNSVASTEAAGEIEIPETRILRTVSDALMANSLLSRRMRNDGSYEELEVFGREQNRCERMSTDESVTIRAGGTSHLEAKNFISADLCDALTIREGILNNAASCTGGSLNYTLFVESTNTYFVYIHTALAAPGRENVLTAFVDGEQRDSLVMDFTENTGGWFKERPLAIGSLYLTAGHHDLSLRINNSALGNVSRFDFVPQGEIPSVDIASTGTTLLEAGALYRIDGSEDISGYAGVVDCTSSCTGSCLYYAVRAEKSSAYCLFAQLDCTAEQAGDDLIEVLIDGKASGLRLDTNENCSDKTFVNFKMGMIELSAGEHTFEVCIKRDGIGKLGGFAFVPDGEKMTTSGRSDSATGNRGIRFSDVADGTACAKDYVSQMSVCDLARLCSGCAYFRMGGMPEYGLPEFIVANGPGGIRESSTGTFLPSETMIACTWNDELVQTAGLVVGIDARNGGFLCCLAPGVNIHRNPLCGRNFEYYSEDPLVSGRLGAAFIRGVQSCGVAVTLKHFAANNQERFRITGSSRVSERALREIYLKSFEIAVAGGSPWAMMTSYNYLNEVKAAESEGLLNGVARGEWGFDGAFVTDWNNDSDQVRELIAGNDIKMPSGNGKYVKAAYDRFEIDREPIEKAAENAVKLFARMYRGALSELPAEALRLCDRFNVLRPDRQ